MTSLSRFGFRKNWVYEGIVSSANKGGSLNNAPMGFSTSDLKTITLRPYKNTRTYKNISRTKKCILHFLSIDEKNISLFHDFIWRKEKKTKKMRSRGHFVLKAERIEEDTANAARSVVFCSVTRVAGNVSLFSRAPFLAFECVVKASKLGLGLEGDPLLRAIIKNHFETISRIAPHSKYERIAKACAEL